MLALAEVGFGDVVYDIGCGDGRLVIEAAHRYGARGVGVDLDPRLIAKARANARRAGVEDRVTLLEQDAESLDLSSATVVMLYLLPATNLRLPIASSSSFARAPASSLIASTWATGRPTVRKSSPSTMAPPTPSTSGAFEAHPRPAAPGRRFLTLSLSGLCGKEVHVHRGRGKISTVARVHSIHYVLPRGSLQDIRLGPPGSSRSAPFAAGSSGRV